VGGDSPFYTLPPDQELVTSKGREVSAGEGQAVVWELGGATYMLERRPVKVEDIFVRPDL